MRKNRLQKIFGLFMTLLVVSMVAVVSTSCGTDDEDLNLDTFPVFKMGMLLTKTGEPEIGHNYEPGVRLAVKEIEEAGVHVILAERDSACSLDTAEKSFSQLMDEGVHGIIGAGCSSVSLELLDEINEYEIAMISPVSSSPILTTEPTSGNGFFFRSKPSDAFRAVVIAKVVAEDGGADNIAVIHINDAYGNALKDALIETVGGNSEITQIPYSPESTASEYAEAARQASSSNPDAVVILPVGAERTDIIAALIAADTGPSQTKIYLAGATPLNLDASVRNLLEISGEEVLVEGIKGITTSFPENPDFARRIMEFAPEIGCPSCPRHAYDAAVIMVLAALSAETVEPSEYVNEISAVTRNGEKCQSFSECLDLVVEGKDIDYDGVSGTIELDDAGDPTEGIYEISRYNADGIPVKVGSISVP
ncbi:MAG: ABC transporter substrate-binding protein [Candidatus Dadabacteria bacterium]|nr:ABC transporter substrate-binding protein [Candidatus Dadabacteria bacterium]